MTGASPALASCGSTSTEAYVDCTAELGTIAPLGVINANNWDFGPRNYGIFYNGQLIGTTSNYIHGHTAGRDAQNDNGYIAWASGPRIRQQIYVRIFDDTFGNTVTSLHTHGVLVWNGRVHFNLLFGGPDNRAQLPLHLALVRLGVWLSEQVRWTPLDRRNDLLPQGRVLLLP